MVKNASPSAPSSSNIAMQKRFLGGWTSTGFCRNGSPEPESTPRYIEVVPSGHSRIPSSGKLNLGSYLSTALPRAKSFNSLTRAKPAGARQVARRKISSIASTLVLVPICSISVIFFPTKIDLPQADDSRFSYSNRPELASPPALDFPEGKKRAFGAENG